MPILLGVIVSVAVIFAVFAVTLGRGGSMTQFQPDWPGRPLPDERTLRAADVSAAKFSLAFRGYRMAEVDDALDRLAAEIAERDDAFVRLTGRPFESQRTAMEQAVVPVPAPVAMPTDAPLSDDTAPMGLPPIAPVDESTQVYMRPPAPDDTAQLYVRPPDDRPMYDGPDQ